MFRKTIHFALALSIALPPHVWALNPPKDDPSPEDVNAQQTVMIERWLKIVFDTESGRPSGQKHPLDTFQVLPQKVNAVENEVRVVAWPKVVAVLRSAKDTKPISIVPLAQGRADIPTVSCADDCTLELRSGFLPEGVTLNELFLPIRLMTAVGPYLAFVTGDHVQGEHVLLNFIDLRTFQASLGNDRLPIFTIPMNLDKPIEDLRAVGEDLIVNGRAITRDQLADISRLYTASFNFTANMLGPKTAAGALAQYEAFDDYLLQTTEDLRADENGTIAAAALVDRIKSIVDVRKNDFDARKEIDAKALKQRLPEMDAEGRALAERFLQESEKARDLDKIATDTKKNFVNGRKFMTRLKAWEGYLTRPSANRGGNIARAIGEVSAYFLRGAREIEKIAGRAAGIEGTEPVDKGAVAAFTAGAVALAHLPGVMPDSYYQMLASGLTIGDQVAGYVGGVLHGAFTASTTSAGRVGHAMLNPSTAFQTYVANDNWYKFVIGGSVFTGAIAMILGAWHVTMRTRDVILDSRKSGYQGLVERQRGVERQFSEELAEGERKSRKSLQDQNEATPEEKEQTRANLARVKAERAAERTNHWTRKPLQPLRWLGKWVGFRQDRATAGAVDTTISPTVGAAMITANEMVEVAASPAQIVLPKKEQQIETRFQAFRHLVISTASYRATVGEYTTGFNAYASYRYSLFGWFSVPFIGRAFERKTGQRLPAIILPRPFAIATRFAFPQFFKTAVTKSKSGITMPTALNGGMEPAWTKVWRWAVNAGRRTSPEPTRDQFMAEEKYFGESDVVTPAGLDALDARLLDLTPDELDRDRQVRERFEDQIIEAEGIVLAEATKAAMREFTKNAPKKAYRDLFETTDGFGSVTSANIRTLAFKEKAFVRGYIDAVYDEAMRRLLNEWLDAHAAETTEGLLTRAERDFGVDSPVMQRLREVAAAEGTIGEETLLELKTTILRMNEGQDVPFDIKFTPERIKEVVAQIADEPGFATAVRARTDRLAPQIETMTRHLRYEVATNYDPAQNGSMKRYDIVRQMQQDPIAMARATRNEISTLFRTLPIEIGAKFLLIAGMTDFLAKPLHDTFWGDNSIAYLSQSQFYGSLLAGIMFSSVSSAWGKLQSDYQNNQKGMFGDIPTGEDAKKGFWSWFWKKWNLKENSFAAYYKEYTNIIFWNLPAAIPQIFLLNMIFMNRFDLDAFLMGYLTIFLLPLHPFIYKVEQVYEQANYHVARGFNEKDLADPDVQAYLQPELQKHRNAFNVKRDLIQNPILEAFNTMFYIGTAATGTYTLWRSILAGFTPTELVMHKLRALSDSLANSSAGGIAKAIEKGCGAILTNGNQALTKLPK